MNLEQALIISPLALPARILAEAREDALTALSAALVAQEAPELLKGLRAAQEAESVGLPELEAQLADAQAALAAQEAATAEAREALAAAPDTKEYRREHFAAGSALKAAEEALRDAEAHARIRESRRDAKRKDCAELAAKVAAVESLPAADPAILAALFPKR